jgi:endonuclease YncB( thermonuclease family)
VRLFGVDAPEKGQAYGSRAQQALSQLIYGRQVVVNSKGTDQFKRVLGIAMVKNEAGSTISVNEALLLQGMAWHFTRYDKNPDWARLQQQAKTAKAGLWADNNPTPPWEWRKNR